jgi:hypothetical protein
LLVTVDGTSSKPMCDLALYICNTIAMNLISRCCASTDFSSPVEHVVFFPQAYRKCLHTRPSRPVHSLEREEAAEVHGRKGGEFIPITLFDIWDTLEWPTSQHQPGTQWCSAPGRYSVELLVSPPESTHLVIGMVNEHGLYFEDSVHMSVSTQFYIWMKYLVFIPPFLLTRNDPSQSLRLAATGMTTAGETGEKG